MEFNRNSINEIKKPMNNDYLEVENADGMPGLVDSTIAMELLLSVKTGIRNDKMKGSSGYPKEPLLFYTA